MVRVGRAAQSHRLQWREDRKDRTHAALQVQVDVVQVEPVLVKVMAPVPVVVLQPEPELCTLVPLGRASRRISIRVEGDSAVLDPDPDHRTEGCLKTDVRPENLCCQHNPGGVVEERLHRGGVGYIQTEAQFEVG